jgi:xanthine phosphoribosyltransferase
MNKQIVSWDQVQHLVSKICRDISVGHWRPDYIVGLTRGGLLPAKMISHYFNIPMHALGANLRDHVDGNGPESNLWMAEDAFGYPKQEIEVEENLDQVLSAADDLLSLNDNFKNILVVDDINDTGATFNWLMEDWRSGCLPDDPSWEEVWNGNVKFAVLFDNLASECEVKMDFAGTEINKAEENVWIDFPWESWWTR